MKQQQEFKKAREALLEKVAARSFAKNYLSSLKSDVSTGRRRFERAVLLSVFYHPVRGKIHAICLCFCFVGGIPSLGLGRTNGSCGGWANGTP